MDDAEKQAVRQLVIASRDDLFTFLFDEDLTDEKLREASERLLPRAADALHLAVGALAQAGASA